MKIKTTQKQLKKTILISFHLDIVRAKDYSIILNQRFILVVITDGYAMFTLLEKVINVLPFLLVMVI